MYMQRPGEVRSAWVSLQVSIEMLKVEEVSLSIRLHLCVDEVASTVCLSFCYNKWSGPSVGPSSCRQINNYFL